MRIESVLIGPNIIGITKNNLTLSHFHWMMGENLARLFGFSSNVVERAEKKSNIVNFDAYQEMRRTGNSCQCAWE